MERNFGIEIDQVTLLAEALIQKFPNLNDIAKLGLNRAGNGLTQSLAGASRQLTAIATPTSELSTNSFLTVPANVPITSGVRDRQTLPVLSQNQTLDEFAPAPTGAINVGGSPHSIISGDWNQDGHLDLVTANTFSNNVTLFLGNSSGGFTPAPDGPVAVGRRPVALIQADWNRDGIADLAVANRDSDNVTILLSNGRGGFSPAPGRPVRVGDLPVALTQGDWNRDGIADLAVVNGNSNSISILLGNGNGAFSPLGRTEIAVGAAPRSIATGDWNRDGILDLAVANSDSNDVTVLLGNGNGGFSSASDGLIAVGAAPRSITTGDWNGDDILDWAVANSESNDVTVLLGNGRGGFEATRGGPIAVGAGPAYIINGDWDRNGTLDLAVVNRDSDDLTVLIGNGAGGFNSRLSISLPGSNRPVSLASGDLDGNGSLDLAVANLVSGNVTVLLNQF